MDVDCIFIYMFLCRNDYDFFIFYNDDLLDLKCSPPGVTRPVSPLSVEVGSFTLLGLFLSFFSFVDYGRNKIFAV